MVTRNLTDRRGKRGFPSPVLISSHDKAYKEPHGGGKKSQAFSCFENNMMGIFVIRLLIETQGWSDLSKFLEELEEESGLLVLPQKLYDPLLRLQGTGDAHKSPRRFPIATGIGRKQAR